MQQRDVATYKVRIEGKDSLGVTFRATERSS